MSATSGSPLPSGDWDCLEDFPSSPASSVMLYDFMSIAGQEGKCSYPSFGQIPHVLTLLLQRSGEANRILSPGPSRGPIPARIAATRPPLRKHPSSSARRERKVALRSGQMDGRYSTMMLVEAVERQEWAGLRRRREKSRVVEFVSLGPAVLWESVRC